MSPERKRKRKKRPVTAEEAEELIRFKKNPEDPEVWKGIVERHHQQNVVQAKRFLDDDRATGEEVVQEAYLQAKAHAADIEEGLERYIFGSLKNLALNWGRDHHREVSVDPRPPNPIEATDVGKIQTLAKMPVNLPHVDWDADDPHGKEDPAMAGEEGDPHDEDRHKPRNDEEVERDEMWELCSRHLEALGSDRDQLIAIYFYQRDMDGDEIARELSIKADEVRTALQRIRRTILAAARAK